MIEEAWRGLLPEVIKRASGSIYHYTSPSGLLGLVEVHELWATEATGMNDLAEVRQGWIFIRNWLERQPSDPITEILHAASTDNHPASDVTGLFMCCASTRADDANQWRLYAGSARGYAVELDSAIPLAALAREATRPVRANEADTKKGRRRWITLGESATVSPWLHVLYTEDDKEAALQGLADNARRSWNEQLAAGFADDEHYDVAGQEFRDGLMTDLARIAQLMKSEGFSGENEVRTIVSVMFDGCSKFRAIDNGVVRYVRLTSAPPGQRRDELVYSDDLSNPTRLPLQSVTLGPLLHAQNNAATIEALLHRNRYPDASVSHSALLLRPGG